MTRLTRSILVLAVAATVLGSAGASPQSSESARPGPSAAPPRSTGEILLDEIGRLKQEIVRVRAELAAEKLASANARREADELRRFIEDHEQLGADFTRYRAVKEVAEREAAQRRSADLQARREEERARRIAARAAAAAEQTEEEIAAEREERYRRAGFAAIGLDVFVGRMAYSYPIRDDGASGAYVDYDPFIGLYYRPGLATNELDYGRMTISGSVLNAAADVRNIGVAIAFFDESGNQVGGETIQISNARPDVPYPFTATIDMALDRPFDSSSVYVLYADPAE
jgi:hypothetical protein